MWELLELYAVYLMFLLLVLVIGVRWARRGGPMREARDGAMTAWWLMTGVLVALAAIFYYATA